MSNIYTKKFKEFINADNVTDLDYIVGYRSIDDNEIKVSLALLEGYMRTDRYVRKDIDDTVNGILTLNKDLIVRDSIYTDTFIPDFKGWKITKEGDLFVRSISAWDSITTPELVKNKISVMANQFWFTDSATIDTVEALGSDRYSVKFKLEPFDGSPFKVGDILKGIFHYPTGFYAAYFKVLSLINDPNTQYQIGVQLESINGREPKQSMLVARMSNTTDLTRQGSVYADGLGKYIRVLNGYSTDGNFENDINLIKLQIGDLSSLKGTTLGDLKGYGLYSDNVYLKGTFLLNNGTNVDTNFENLEKTTADIITGISNIQDQIDGVVENWFYEYSPTLSNKPAIDWVTVKDKDNHIGDTFTNIQQYIANDPSTHDAGKSWRWIKEANGSYKWTIISDSDAVKALQEAAKAKATADGKSTTFLNQPTAYSYGDLWILSSNATVNGVAYLRGDILTSSASSSTFVASHWSKFVRYTDDTYAQAVNTSLAVERDRITAQATSISNLDGRVTQAELNLQPDNIWLGISSKVPTGNNNLILQSYIPVTTNAYNIKMCNLTEKFELNKDYVLTIWGNLAADRYNFAAYIDWEQHLGTVNKVSDGVYQLKFKITSFTSGVTEERKYRLGIFCPPDGLTSSSTITKIQLEYGKTGSAWGYAEEEASSIGGSNLIKNSGNFKSTSKWSTIGYGGELTITSENRLKARVARVSEYQTWGHIVGELYSQMEIGEQYTFQIKVYSPKVVDFRLAFRNPAGTFFYEKWTTLSQGINTVTYTFIYTGVNGNDSLQPVFNPIFSNVTTSDYVEVINTQLKKGVVVTDWSPAPEDLPDTIRAGILTTPGQIEVFGTAIFNDTILAQAIEAKGLKIKDPQENVTNEIKTDGSMHIAGSKTQLNADGSGQFASGNIYWDAIGRWYKKTREFIVWRSMITEMGAGTTLNVSPTEGTYLDISAPYGEATKRINLPDPSQYNGLDFDIRYDRTDGGGVLRVGCTTHPLKYYSASKDQLFSFALDYFYPNKGGIVKGTITSMGNYWFVSEDLYNE